MCEELFGPVLTIYVYEDDKFLETMKLLDETSEYALTGSIFAQDRNDINLALHTLQNAAGNFQAPDAAGTSTFLGGGTINANGTVTLDYKKAIPGAYPLGTTSYGLAYSSGKTASRRDRPLVCLWKAPALAVCAAHR